MRADCTYTAFLNTSFQGLAADGAKIAMWELQKAGFKIVGFCHDEVVIESSTPEKDVAICEKIMQDGMSIVIPDVDIRTEAQIVDRYCK
jgi:DNA polymerase I-like protein with 3'-5' exonuclease and polymerase domains